MSKSAIIFGMILFLLLIATVYLLINPRALSAIRRGGIIQYVYWQRKSVLPYDKNCAHFENGSICDPLIATIASNHRADFDTLLTKGTDPNGINDRFSPLKIAIQLHDLYYAQQLLQHKADPNGRSWGVEGTKDRMQNDTGFESPLEQAILDQDPEAVDLLLSSGADINLITISTKDSAVPALQSRTALIEAASIDDWRMVNHLLDKGASPTLNAQVVKVLTKMIQTSRLLPASDQGKNLSQVRNRLKSNWPSQYGNL